MVLQVPSFSVFRGFQSFTSAGSRVRGQRKLSCGTCDALRGKLLFVILGLKKLNLIDSLTDFVKTKIKKKSGHK